MGCIGYTVYNPRPLGGGGGGVIESKYDEGGHGPECVALSQVLLHPPSTSMSWRWHRHLT